jgi:hypothetical protein
VNVINSVDCDVIFVFSFVSPEYWYVFFPTFNSFCEYSPFFMFNVISVKEEEEDSLSNNIERELHT